MFNVTINGSNITQMFGEGEVIINDVRGRGISSREASLLEIPSRAGAYLQRVKTPARVLEVDITLQSDDLEQMRKRIDSLNNVLVSDSNVPIEFEDEGMVYYGVLSGDVDWEEITTKAAKGTIAFVCSDPYKYGAEQTGDFADNTVTVQNNGTAETFPTIEITANTDITHLDMVRDDGEYMRIGNPARADQQTFARMTQILHDTCTTTTGWTTANAVDNGYIAGSMVSDGAAFIADSFGTPVTPHEWQGPSIKKSFSESLTNFRMDVMIEHMNASAQTGMIEIYLLDANNNVVMKMGLEDIWRSIKTMQGKMQLGPDDATRHQYYRQPDWPHGWNDFDGVLRLYRDDYSGEQRIRPYFAIIQPDGKHVWVSSQYFYKDAASQYQTPITQIQIAIRKWPETEEAQMRIKDIKVWKFNTQQGVPYIATAGDVITLDHANEDIRINGESRKDLKDFGASFFSLPPGYTTLYQFPQDTMTTNVKWRDRYL